MGDGAAMDSGVERCGMGGGIAAASASGAAAVDCAINEHDVDACRSPYVVRSAWSAASEGMGVGGSCWIRRWDVSMGIWRSLYSVCRDPYGGRRSGNV